MDIQGSIRLTLEGIIAKFATSKVLADNTFVLAEYVIFTVKNGCLFAIQAYFFVICV